MACSDMTPAPPGFFDLVVISVNPDLLLKLMELIVSILLLKLIFGIALFEGWVPLPQDFSKKVLGDVLLCLF